MSELKVIESKLVPVYETDSGERVVYGTELYSVLEVKSNYRDWIKNRLNDCDAVENVDFQSFAKKLAKGGRPQTEYIIKLNTAKEMAMLERNDKGKQVRRYFIAVEEKYKEATNSVLISTGTKIKLYRNNQWGILDIGGDLYNLTPDEFELVSRLIPALDKNGVKQVPLVITTILGLSGRSGKLEYIGTYRCHDNYWNR